MSPSSGSGSAWAPCAAPCTASVVAGPHLDAPCQTAMTTPIGTAQNLPRCDRPSPPPRRYPQTLLSQTQPQPQAAGRQWPRRPMCPGSRPFPEKALQEYLALSRPPSCCLRKDCWTNCGEPAAIWTPALRPWRVQPGIPRVRFWQLGNNHLQGEGSCFPTAATPPSRAKPSWDFSASCRMVKGSLQSSENAAHTGDKVLSCPRGQLRPQG